VYNVDSFPICEFPVCEGDVTKYHMLFIHWHFTALCMQHSGDFFFTGLLDQGQVITLTAG